MPDSFHIIDPTDSRPAAERARAFEVQRIPPTLGNLVASAPLFQPEPGLVAAVNASLALGAPLLVTGEPGTGKTQIAYWVAHHLGLDPKTRVFSLFVKSTTTAEDLLYRFDHVAYFHAANDPRKKEQEIPKENFRTKGPLWKAFESEKRCVVLIDEIDKALRDFPNDLLHELDQHAFEARETGESVSLRPGAPPPLVVVTSNSERRLPEAFLRRCVFYPIELTEDLVRRAVQARQKDFERLDEATRDAAIRRFYEVRERAQRKKPATGELLVWLVLLNARGATREDIDGVVLRELPALGALIKDRDDMAAL